MDLYQQFFCILFAVFYGSLLAVVRDFGPFDTAGIWAGVSCGMYYTETTKRFLFSFLMFVIFPSLYFVFGYYFITVIEVKVLSAHGFLTITSIIIYTTSIFGLWRIYFGTILLKTDNFYSKYEKEPYAKCIEKMLGERPEQHREPKNHITPGLLWAGIGPIPLIISALTLN